MIGSGTNRSDGPDKSRWDNYAEVMSRAFSEASGLLDRYQCFRKILCLNPKAEESLKRAVLLSPGTQSAHRKERLTSQEVLSSELASLTKHMASSGNGFWRARFCRASELQCVRSRRILAFLRRQSMRPYLVLHARVFSSRGSIEVSLSLKFLWKTCVRSMKFAWGSTLSL
jgi:hypothetical protein